MFDARIFCKELNTAHRILKNKQAIFKGEYVIHDSIFSSKIPEIGIGSMFLRLRYVSKNIWNDKPFIVTIKETELKTIGKVSTISAKTEFDTKQEAEIFIKNNYSSQFSYLYKFDRVGWQYDLEKDQVDLEDIEGHYSIEFKSKTEDGLRELLKYFGNPEPIRGPSVVVIKELLHR